MGFNRTAYSPETVGQKIDYDYGYFGYEPSNPPDPEQKPYVYAGWYDRDRDNRREKKRQLEREGLDPRSLDRLAKQLKALKDMGVEI